MRPKGGTGLNLKLIRIPNRLSDIIEVYKQFTHETFECWCTLQYHDAFKAKKKFAEQIEECAKLGDPENSVRVCIGAVILAKFSQTFRDHCSLYLKNIRLQRENTPAFSEFISIYTAKHVNRFRTSSQFIVPLLTTIYDSLNSSNSRPHNDKHSLNLLYNLTVYATRALDQCTSTFYKSLILAFCNSAQEIRKYAMNTLSNYFQLTKQKQHPKMLHDQARSLLSSNFPKNHGGMLIMITLIDYFPNYYGIFDTSAFDIIIKKAKQSKLLTACDMIQIALTPIFPEYYQNFIENFLNTNWPTDTNKQLSPGAQLIGFALKKYPEAFQKRVDKLLSLIEYLLSTSEQEKLSFGSTLLLAFMNNLPKEFELNIQNVANILLKTHYTNDFVSVFEKIITQNPLVWNYLSAGIRTLLTRLLDENKSSIVAHLLALLPEVPSQVARFLKEPIEALLYNSEIKLRTLIPSALLALAKYLPDQAINIGSTLISLALIDESWKMRLAILESFKPPYPSYLAYPQFIDQFSNIINDENFKVRCAAIKLLGGVVSINPAMIYPMFRSILLDILFLCESSKSMRKQSDATLLLPMLFSSAVPILPIYVPVFMPIALQYLKEHLPVAANEIDDPHNFKTISAYQPVQMSFNSTLSYSRPSMAASLSTSMDSRLPVNKIHGAITPITPISDNVAQRMIYGEQMSFFERSFATTIIVNYIHAIGSICDTSFELIQGFIKEITTLLLETIGRAAHKSVLLAAIGTLGKIIDKLGPIEASKITDLNITLLKLGSRITSSKVYTAIFTLLGKIGPVMPESSLNVLISEVKAPENVDLSLPREDFFVRAVVSSLFFILDDKSEADLHSPAHLALSRTFSTCPKSVNSQRLFRSYVSRLFTTINALSPDERSNYLQYISTLLSCPMEWLQQYSLNFFKLIDDLWDTENNIDVLEIIPKLASALKDEFSPYMPRVVSLLIDAFKTSCLSGQDDEKQFLILEVFRKLPKFAMDFMFIIIQQLCLTIVQPQVLEPTRLAALDTLRSLVQNFNCSTYSSVIIRTCFQLSKQSATLRDSILQVLYSLAVSLNSKFSYYQQSLKAHDLLTNEMQHILKPTNKKKKLIDFPFIRLDKKEPQASGWTPQTTIDEDSLTKQTQINNDSLTNEIWKQWIKQFIKAFIIHSPNPAIQSCIEIAEKSPLFNRKIFNAAFLSCWDKLNDLVKPLIQVQISHALDYQTHTPSSVITALIGLVEFTDRAGMPIEGSYYNRTQSALNAGKATFALYCAQRDFDTTKEISARNFDLLVQIYSELGMFDEARGMTKIAGNLAAADQTLTPLLHKLELSEQWEKLANYYQSLTSQTDPEKRQTGVTFAHAFYHLHNWDLFDQVLKPCEDQPNAIILKCLRYLNSSNQNISNLINEGFIKLGQQGGPLFLHGFTAVAPYIVSAQQLVEIKEFWVNKNLTYWDERLSLMNTTFNTIRPLLHMRIDLLEKVNGDPYPVQLSFLKLARKANEWIEFEDFFNLHFSSKDIHSQSLCVKYEYLHLLKKKGSDKEALEFLDDCLNTKPNDSKEIKVYSKFFFKKAKWIARENIEDVESQMKQVIELCNKSLEFRPNIYTTKNLWSWANMRLFDLHNLNNGSIELQEQEAINAINGFANCIKLDTQDTFFDLLQMTSILFRSTKIPGVFQKTISLIKSIELKRFIKVIPQLLVYQYTHSDCHRDFVREILTDLLNKYSNAVIFPLLFVQNADGGEGIKIKEMLSRFSMNHNQFYLSAQTVLYGLKKACLTFPDYLCEGIEKISKELASKSPLLKESVHTLSQRIQETLTNPQSPYEASFIGTYKKSLELINTSFERYLETNEIAILESSNNDRLGFSKVIRSALLSEGQLSIKDVAPELEDLGNLPLVPISFLPKRVYETSTEIKPTLSGDKEKRSKHNDFYDLKGEDTEYKFTSKPNKIVNSPDIDASFTDQDNKNKQMIFNHTNRQLICSPITSSPSDNDSFSIRRKNRKIAFYKTVANSKDNSTGSKTNEASSSSVTDVLEAATNLINSSPKNSTKYLTNQVDNGNEDILKPTNENTSTQDDADGVKSSPLLKTKNYNFYNLSSIANGESKLQNTKNSNRKKQFNNLSELIKDEETKNDLSDNSNEDEPITTPLSRTKNKTFKNLSALANEDSPLSDTKNSSSTNLSAIANQNESITTPLSRTTNKAFKNLAALANEEETNTTPIPKTKKASNNLSALANEDEPNTTPISKTKKAFNNLSALANEDEPNTTPLPKTKKAFTNLSALVNEEETNTTPLPKTKKAFNDLSAIANEEEPNTPPLSKTKKASNNLSALANEDEPTTTPISKTKKAFTNLSALVNEEESNKIPKSLPIRKSNNRALLNLSSIANGEENDSSSLNSPIKKNKFGTSEEEIDSPLGIKKIKTKPRTNLTFNEEDENDVFGDTSNSEADLSKSSNIETETIIRFTSKSNQIISSPETYTSPSDPDNKQTTIVNNSESKSGETLMFIKNKKQLIASPITSSISDNDGSKSDQRLITSIVKKNVGKTDNQNKPTFLFTKNTQKIVSSLNHSSSIDETMNSQSKLKLHVVPLGSGAAAAVSMQNRSSSNITCPLAVFNTFEADKPIITISKFIDILKIKPTKHRPRKLKIQGSNGKIYKFLLKGHEDLRVDQRMMQYFELMNSIASSSIPKITITGVTPLTRNVGLIQWVPSCDTMKNLISEIRKIRKIRKKKLDEEEEEEKNDNEKEELTELSGELNLMKALINPDMSELIDTLTPIQRLEPLEIVMNETSSNDLRDMMWLKAQDAESWVRHTLNFSKTSAVMSIVGYIIGLGDRHPANIMIQRFSGNVIHIDFGDYFDVTKERKQLAEKIPFRLTRMMIATFGPCGIEGSFRRTCEETVQTIREHREAVMSILEIFIREPCSSGDFFENTSDDQTNVISGSVAINHYMKDRNQEELFTGNEKKIREHEKLLKSIRCISQKVNGLDFDNEIPLSVSEQVDKLIQTATDIYNLAYLYHGWNPLW